MTTKRAEQLLREMETAIAQLRALLGVDMDNAEGGDDVNTYDELDRARRRRPEWRRRGRVFYAIEREGGRVSSEKFEDIVLKSGYEDLRGANGFFRGDPEPVLARAGSESVEAIQL